MLDIKLYKPGRFEYLMEKPFAKELWEYLCAEERLNLMLSATVQGKPALCLFLNDIESRFKEHLSSPDHPEEEICTFANNMIKQIMEMRGYELVACGLCYGMYFKSSGMYRRINE